MVESGIVKLHCKIQLSEVAKSYATVCCAGAGSLGALLVIHHQILLWLFNFIFFFLQVFIRKNNKF